MASGRISRIWDKHWGKIVLSGVGFMGLRWAVKRYRTGLEREYIGNEAMVIGAQPLAVHHRPHKLQLVVNRKAGLGGTREAFQSEMAYVLHLAGMDYSVMETQEPEEAKRFVTELDLNKFDGICVVGGDGLLQEVVTGLMRRPDREKVENFPIGVVPMGSANMLANELHTHKSNTATSRVGRAILAMAQHKTRKMDVLEITNQHGQTVYAMSLLGWGLAGIMAQHSEGEQWLRSHRYWYGAIQSFHPSVWGTQRCRAVLSYPLPRGGHYDESVVTPPPETSPTSFTADTTAHHHHHSRPPVTSRWNRHFSGGTVGSNVSAGGASDRYATSSALSSWVHEDLDMSCFVAAMVSDLTLGRVVDRSITPNDGHVNLYWMPSEYLATRLDVYKFGVKLNKGMGLVDVPGVEGVRVQEFALDIVANDGDAGATARSSKVNMAPLNIDGEAMPQSSVRVKVLPRALTFYAQDDRASPDAAVSDG
eukprot:m.1204679 g.1204679  ORF g.1204679 m.1204679 type:complete len:478 (+) comp24581_c0_seq4:276-1709(+)